MSSLTITKAYQPFPVLVRAVSRVSMAIFMMPIVKEFPQNAVKFEKSSIFGRFKAKRRRPGPLKGERLDMSKSSGPRRGAEADGKNDLFMVRVFCGSS